MKAAQILGRIESHRRQVDNTIKQTFEISSKLVDDEDIITSILRGKLRGKALIHNLGVDQWEIVFVSRGELVRLPAVFAHEVEVPETRSKPDAGCRGECKSNTSVEEFLAEWFMGGTSVLNGTGK